MWLSLYVLLFINIPGWTGQVKSVCFLLTAFLTYENNLFYCSRLFPTFPRDHRVLLLRVGEGWCVLFWSVEKLVHFIATAALPRTVTELCNRNIKSYIYRERCTPKQWNRPKIQVCFPVTACTEFYAFWSILHLPTLKCFFFFVLFSNKAGGGGKSNNHRRGGMIDHLFWVVFISTSSESSFDASPPHSLEWNSVSVGNTFQWYYLTPHLSIAKLVIEVRHVGGGHKQKAEIRLGLRCLWSVSP